MGGTYRHGVSDEEIAAASQKARAGDNFTRQQRDYWQEQAMRYERERDEAKARIEALERDRERLMAEVSDRSRDARREALEEAARVVERNWGTVSVSAAGTELPSWPGMTSQLADAIRALREKE